jgi:hypothetical protein
VRPPQRGAAEITQAGAEGRCPISKAALEMFCAMLGTFAGNIALTFGARGGVFIAGGIVPRITDYVARSQFRARFEAKGRLRPYLEALPVYVILNTDAAFLGLRSLAQHSEPPNSLSPHQSQAVDCFQVRRRGRRIERINQLATWQRDAPMIANPTGADSRRRANSSARRPPFSLRIPPALSRCPIAIKTQRKVCR